MSAALAIARRDLIRYFTGPTGYVFIFLFTLLTAGAQFFRDSLFASNLASLQPQIQWFPYILALFVAVVTMGTWADERRQGTDELLLTLPAPELGIVLGKYLAALGIYTAALAFSLTSVIVLAFLGSPDGGLLLSTYFGYWLLGAALLAVGMIGSMLSPNVTVGFILAAAFGLTLVILGDIETFFAGLRITREGEGPGWTLKGAAIAGALVWAGAGIALAIWVRRGANVLNVVLLTVALLLNLLNLAGLFYLFWPVRLVAAAGLRDPFSELTGGVLAGDAILHLAAVAGVGVAVNHWMLLARRRTAGVWHFHLRGLLLVIGLGSLTVLAGRTGCRPDITAERLHSLSSRTVEILRSLPADRAVLVQAFVSPEVPTSYVETRNTLLNLLREFEARSSGRVKVHVRETRKSSEDAREAEDRYGIRPVSVDSVQDGRRVAVEFHLGVVMSSGLEEAVIPFLYRGLSPEYELIRSIRVVTGGARKKVGVVANDTQWLGGFDQQTFSSRPTWRIVEELRSQYEVVEIRIQKDTPIGEKVDALVVPLASSMLQEEMDQLLTYVRTGVPTLFVEDPIPLTASGANPNEPKSRGGGPFAQPGAPRGDARRFYRSLGIQWEPGEVVWDRYNPHPRYADVPPEIIFVGAGSGASAALNPRDSVTSGLQEIILLFGGRVQSTGAGDITFTPLLRTGTASGVMPYSEAWTRSFFGPAGPNPNRRHVLMGEEFVLAARVKGTLPPAEAGGAAGSVNAIFIADLDVVSEQFFQIRQDGLDDLQLDNVTLFLNAVDSLVGDEGFIDIRKRRRKHRTLVRVESLTREHHRRMLEENRKAEDDAKAALESAQKELDRKVQELEEREDLDPRTKRIMRDNLQEVEQRRFDLAKRKIEDEKKRRIDRSAADLDNEVRAIQNRIRWVAVLLPPVPPFLIALIVLSVRLGREWGMRR